MIEFYKTADKVIASYTTTQDSNEWVFDKLENDESHSFNKVYTFSEKDIYKKGESEHSEGAVDIFDKPDPIDFLFAILDGEYYKVIRGVLVSKFDIYIHKDIEISSSLFLAESDFSIFREIENLINEDIYIGGKNESSIPEESFLNLVAEFPTVYEKKLYAKARLSSVIKEFFKTTQDAESKFEKYRNKKKTKRGVSLIKTFKEFEIIKFETIHKKLTLMLNDENGYSEHQWQTEILEIILLLYPKYIYVFKEVPVYASDIKEKSLDFLLVDSNGNTDVIEIKKPFENAIMTTGLYRDNYIPLRELSGTVMQLEKYIYYLNRWSVNGEAFLTNKYSDQLPAGFDIKITNPGGIIIMGRENNLNVDQKRDFEVVKRKYKNVIDIMTYDSLLNRLRFTIDQFKKS